MCVASAGASLFALYPSILSFEFNINALAGFVIANSKVWPKSMTIFPARIINLPFVSLQQRIIVVDVMKLAGFGNEVIIGIRKKFAKSLGKILFRRSRQFAAKRLPVFS